MITYKRFVDSKFRKYFFEDCSSYTENLKVTDTINDHSGCVNTIDWDKTGTRILSGGDDTILRIHQYMCDSDKPWIKNNIFNVSLPKSRNILSAKFMPIYNERVVSASKCGSIFIFDINKSIESSIQLFYKHLGPVLNISTIHHNPNNFISVSNDKTVCFFDIRESSCKPTTRMLFPCSLSSVAVHPINTNKFATGGSDSFVRVFDLRYVNASILDVNKTLKSVSEVCRPLEYTLDLRTTNNGALGGYGRRNVNNITYEPNFGRFMLVNYMYDCLYMFDTKVNENNEAVVNQVDEPQNTPRTFHIRYNWDNTGPPENQESRTPEIVCPPSIQSFINDIQQKELGCTDDTTCLESSLKSQLTSVPRYKQIWTYYGQLNCRTMIKDSRFWGNNYILAGSECGNILIWTKKSHYPVAAIQTDRHVTNRIEPHPFLPIIATCGIDHEIKIVSSDFQPNNEIEVKPESRLKMILLHNQSRAEKAKNSESISMLDLLRIMRAQRMMQTINNRTASNDQ